jgi:hypothetical protein
VAQLIEDLLKKVDQLKLIVLLMFIFELPAIEDQALYIWVIAVNFVHQLLQIDNLLEWIKFKKQGLASKSFEWNVSGEQMSDRITISHDVT